MRAGVGRRESPDADEGRPRPGGRGRYDKGGQLMFDRSISALRTLRPSTEFDSKIFWFRDDLHQPYCISPMGMTTTQAHHAWGYHKAAAATSLPPSKGGHVKIYRGRVYLGFALIDDPELVKRARPQVRRDHAGVHRRLGGLLQPPDRRSRAQQRVDELRRHRQADLGARARVPRAGRPPRPAQLGDPLRADVPGRRHLPGLRGVLQGLRRGREGLRHHAARRRGYAGADRRGDLEPGQVRRRVWGFAR